MIPRVFGTVGEPIRLKGSAYDFGHAISSIQFSLDKGSTWTSYETPGANDYQNLAWTFDWTPSIEGLHMLHVRSVNDEGAASPEAACVEIMVESRRIARPEEVERYGL